MTGRHAMSDRDKQLIRNFAQFALADGGDYDSIRRRLAALKLEHDALGTPIEQIVRPPLCPEPDEPPRCWSCGHTTDIFCECQCCDDDHDGGPDDV